MKAAATGHERASRGVVTGAAVALAAFAAAWLPSRSAAAADGPAADKAAADNPTADSPGADNPAADNPTADKPAADRAAADQPAPPGLPHRSLPVEVFATAFVGDGLRFNNPYRLATVLGSDAQSLSRTASYADVGVTFALGNTAGAAHGLALRTSIALEGVRQAVFTPSYLLFRRWSAWAVYGRVGLPLVLTPDTTWGFEGGAGGVWFVRAGIGLAAELVGDVFYGAGTREVATPAYPVLSGQGGLFLSWEAWP